MSVVLNTNSRFSRNTSTIRTSTSTSSCDESTNWRRKGRFLNSGVVRKNVEQYHVPVGHCGKTQSYGYVPFVYSNSDSSSVSNSTVSSNITTPSLSGRSSSSSIRSCNSGRSVMTTISSITVDSNSSDRSDMSDMSSYDNSLFDISKPETNKYGIVELLKQRRFYIKRTVLLYGIPSDYTKEKVFRNLRKYGQIDSIIAEGEEHPVIGKPSISHARQLTRQYVTRVDEKETTCFYVIYKTKGGFKKCAQGVLGDPIHNIFKMDKKIAEFTNPSC